MTKVFFNRDGYAYHGSSMGDLEGTPNNMKRHTLEVTFVTDMVPGAFYNPEDLMQWIMQNPYVDTVILKD